MRPMTRAAVARSALSASLALGFVACVAPVSAPDPGPPALERSARVVRAVFHDADIPSDAELGAELGRRVEERLAPAPASPDDTPLELDFQFAHLEVQRRLRVATLPLAIVTASLYALLGPDAWQVESRLHGRLRVRDDSGCVLAESVAMLEYSAPAGFGVRASPPELVRVLEVVDLLVERAARRLDR